MTSSVQQPAFRGPMNSEPAIVGRSPILRQAVSIHRALSILFICFLTVMHPAIGATPEDGVNGKCSVKADRFMAQRLRVWQQRLKLDDWTISVTRVRRSDLNLNTLGNIRWYESEKLAMIRVLDPSEYHGTCRVALNDMEFTVVHELIHVKLSPLPRSEASRTEEEFAVNQITNALLSLDRRRGQ